MKEKEISEGDELIKEKEAFHNKTSDILGKLDKMEIDHQISNLQAVENPWEPDEIEGLSYTDIYSILNLVPAQQAKLAELCMEELIKCSKKNGALKTENEDLEVKVILLEDEKSETSKLKSS